MNENPGTDRGAIVAAVRRVELRGGPGHGQTVRLNVMPFRDRAAPDVVIVVIDADGAAYSLDTVPPQVMRTVPRENVHTYVSRRSDRRVCHFAPPVATRRVGPGECVCGAAVIDPGAMTGPGMVRRHIS